MADIVILGAGLTGLSTAYHLEQNGFHNFKIFEKNKTSGGLLRSFNENGFIFDFTGHLLHINNEYFKKFIDKVCGIENFDLNKRNSSIFFNNNLIPYPFQMNLHKLEPNTIIDVINGFINRKKSLKQPKSFYDWVLKYFGSGMGKHFFFPYNSKLLSFNVKEITPSWTGRFVPKTNLKKVLNSAFNKNDQNNIGYNSYFYYPKNDGIYFLIQSLEKNLKSKVYTEFNATNIDLKTKTVFFENGHKESFKKLITTLPLDNLLKSIKEKSNTNLKKQADNLICNSVVNYNLGFQQSELPKKHWVYFPKKRWPFYRVGFWHNISKNSTPKNNCSLYGEISYIPGQKTQRQINNLTSKAIKDTINIFKLKKSNLVTEKVLNLPHAYVIYNFWREKNLKQLHKRLGNYAVYSIGRYGEWKYSSMQEAVLDGKLAAKKVLEALENKFIGSTKIKKQNLNTDSRIQKKMSKTGKRVGL